jgi:hypothetical protein
MTAIEPNLTIVAYVDQLSQVWRFHIIAGMVVLIDSASLAGFEPTKAYPENMLLRGIDDSLRDLDTTIDALHLHVAEPIKIDVTKAKCVCSGAGRFAVWHS